MGQYNYHVGGIQGRGHTRKWNRVKYGFALLELRTNHKSAWYEWVGVAHEMHDAQAWVEGRPSKVKIFPKKH